MRDLLSFQNSVDNLGIYPASPQENYGLRSSHKLIRVLTFLKQYLSSHFKGDSMDESITYYYRENPKSFKVWEPTPSNSELKAFPKETTGPEK